MSVKRHYDREFVRTFFTSPTAVDGEDDSAKMLRSAGQLRGLQAPDVWVPDNEDATAPNMREEGVENIIEVVSEQGAEFPGEIHPRVVWHRESPTTRYQGFQQMLEITDPENGAVEHIDGFVIPEVGDIDDWKKADEFFTIIEHEHGLEEGSLSMSVIVESGEAELAMGDLREEMGKPSNNLERMFLLVDGEVDYTKDMRAMTPTGELPPWPELRHNTSRGASAAGLIAVDGPYDDIRDVEGYRERMKDNRAKGMTGIWSLTPGQVVEANTAPLPPKTGSWLLDVGGQEVELDAQDGKQVYDGDDLSLETDGEGGYVLQAGGDRLELDEDELTEELLDRTAYIPSMTDIVDSMEEFEAAKEAGKGAIAMTQAATLVIDGVEVEVSKDRMWDEATYQAAQTPITLFQDVYEHRPDQHEELAEMYGTDIVERATAVGN
ncbi:malate synthase [Haloarcula hispanica N601]|uniref:Malate synthase n=3 Tax=Haloarcula hispanica TaxID=51589 RepID=A0A482TCH3_HALHI|nr:MULTISPECIES: malate synthase AceB [Haloarcula]AEM58063.1 malate synthase [Haloarcula hispanica ATCC 33960]AHB66807.1 malate synthase [Haloarcula hispanica N601]KAA9406273.1 malate synthase [Haloarcula sp. CBA1131]KAA9410692.1 malate synthase [Haloarcula hispanica]MCJ0619783.1 malate synthase [Haloarcula hispanica]